MVKTSTSKPFLNTIDFHRKLILSSKVFKKYADKNYMKYSLSLDEMQELWLEYFESVTANKKLSVFEMAELYKEYSKRLIASGNSARIVKRAECLAEEKMHISQMKTFIVNRMSTEDRIVFNKTGKLDIKKYFSKKMI